MSITHQNHYVPKWYQQYFLAGKNKFYYCDLKAPKVTLPDGRSFYHRNLWQKGVASCFFDEDLYTLNFGKIETDVIEREFFGPREKMGYKAWPIFISESWENNYPKSWQDVLEFMDSQWFRTTKGIEFLKKTMQLSGMPISTNAVLGLMVQIHRFQTTVWAECIWEIVSAENSTTKFLLTDHPVTLYHPFWLPKMRDYKFANDPHPWKIGTQVVYPLSMDKCLILTHLQNVRDPEPMELLLDRQNARAFSWTIKNVADIIRNRHLSENEVIRINYLLKSRAHRYIAAIEKEWLYPEKYLDCIWQDIRKVLLPDKNKNFLTLAGGEIFVGFEDGKAIAIDEFGRPINEVDAAKEIARLQSQVEKIAKKQYKKKHQGKID